MTATGKMVLGYLAVCALVAACAGHPQLLSAKPGQHQFHVSLKPAPGTPAGSRGTGASIAAGTAGTYQLGEQ